jgi:hypothetical protein
VMSAFTEKGGATSSREDRRAWLLVSVGCRVEQRNEAAPQLGGHNTGASSEATMPAASDHSCGTDEWPQHPARSTHGHGPDKC